LKFEVSERFKSFLTDSKLSIGTKFMEKRMEVNMITEEKMNEILLEAASQNVNMRGSKFVFKKLPTVAVHKTVYFTTQEIVEKIQRVGEILEVKEDESKVVAIVCAGAGNLNPAIVVAVGDEDMMHLAAYAKEGLIKQHTSEKAIQRILEA